MCTRSQGSLGGTRASHTSTPGPAHQPLLLLSCCPTALPTEREHEIEELENEQLTKEIMPESLKEKSALFAAFPSRCHGIWQTFPLPAVGPMAGVGLGPSVPWVSTSSVPLLQLSNTISSVPRAAPPPSDQDVRDSSAAALRPRGVGIHFGQRKGEFLPLPYVGVGRDPTDGPRN